MRTARSTASTVGLLTAAFVTAVALAGCTTTDKIVYRDRLPFNPPTDSAKGFLGYYDAAQKRTTCGNCHADFQGLWENTRHARAFIDVDTNASRTAACYGCHSTSGNGNKAAGTLAGYLGVKTATYHDVQCENCHGAGLQHVEGVGRGSLTRPLARISMAGTGNCGDCHSGAHQPFAEEWAQSGHAIVNASRAGNTASGCANCHDGRKVLARWGVQSNYVERDSATAYQPTTCAVCHAPHGSANPRQLRFPVTSTDPTENLCMQCHLRRAEPELTASTPHAPQGAVLLGFAGWRPPGFAYDTTRIYGSHATALNPKLCAGCHVGRFTVTDKITGAFTFQATGHLFRPIPCLDSLGKPTGIKTCAYTTAARTFQTCAVSSCHATQDAAANAFGTVRARMKFLADQLWLNSNNDGTLQATPTDGGLLATLKSTQPTQWSNTDTLITPAEGAEFNARMCGEYNQSNSDNSKGIHNPFLCEALLIATINYVRTYYSLPAASVGVQAEMNRTLSAQFGGSMHISSGPPPEWASRSGRME